MPGNVMSKEAISRTAETIRDYPFLKQALAYRREQLDVNGEPVDGSIPETERKIRILENKIHAIDMGLELLPPEERDVIRELYLEHHTAEDVCENCSMERCSVYRYRKKALRKLAIIFNPTDQKI